MVLLNIGILPQSLHSISTEKTINSSNALFPVDCQTVMIGEFLNPDVPDWNSLCLVTGQRTGAKLRITHSGYR
jgi:hypothetical protein